MATLAEIEEELETTETEETEVEEVEDATELEDLEESENEPEEEEEEEDVEITLDGESLSPDEEDGKEETQLIKHLRKTQKETQKRVRELQRQLEEREQARQAQPQAHERKPKPKYEDFYDSEEYEKALTGWFDEERKVQEAEAKRKETEAELAREQQARLEAYQKQKAELRKADYEDAEEVVMEHFSVEQQEYLLRHPKNRAALVYAIGKRPQEAERLSKIKDPVQFIYELAEVSSRLSVKSVKKKMKPQPEGKVVGNGNKTAAVDSTLKRLQAEAMKTGNMKKLLDYERKLKAKKTT